MKKKKQQGHTPKIDEWIEIQDHQYDPGYWLGGNIHPLIRAQRPNRYGYVLAFISAVPLLFLALDARRNQNWLALFWFCFLLVFFVAVGIHMVRKGPASRPPEKRP